MRKVVFDTNVYISGILFNGIPRKCLELAIEGEFALAVSPHIMDEIRLVLAREKFGIAPEKIQLIAQEIESISTLVTPQKKITGACRDRKDHIILECALAAQAEKIVTGDDDLLSLKSFQNIDILNCRDFMELFS